MNNTSKYETRMTLEQARLEWYKLDPKNQTHLNMGGTDEIAICMKLLAQHKFDGFIMGLQYAGMVIVK